jgi:hypothetical protein
VKEGELQWAGFYLAGLLCLVLMAVKLTLALPWSWWRILLPLWAVLLHNGVHIAIGFIWLTWMGCGREGDDLRIRRHHRLDRYQFERWAHRSFLTTCSGKWAAPANRRGGGWRREGPRSSCSPPARC